MHARGQHHDDDHADHADRDRGRPAVCDQGRRKDGRVRRRDRDHRIRKQFVNRIKSVLQGKLTDISQKDWCLFFCLCYNKASKLNTNWCVGELA